MATTTNETPMSRSATISSDITAEGIKIITGFFKNVGVLETIKPEHNVDDSFSNLIGGLLKVISIERGKISCLINVKAPILNAYSGMHGGAVGAVAVRVATACARTVVGKDMGIFLGELNISYLSAAPHKTELLIEGSVVKSGRNVTAVAVDFRHKESGRLAFMTRATFYNLPVSRL